MTIRQFFVPVMCAALAVGLALVSPARAGAGGDSEVRERPHVLEDVVVVAEREGEILQTGDVDKEATPAFYSTIPREEFAGKMESLAEVVEREVGVQVRQAGALGSFSTISLRGSSSDQVMVFIDGILLNDASGGGVDISNIALSDVAGIDIYRGVTPVNFGKASVGGVVNVRTLRTRGKLEANAGVGYGSFNTNKAFGYVNHKPGAFDYLLSAGYLGSDNDFTFTNDMGTDWNKADDREQKRANAEFGQYNLLGKVGYDFTPNLRVDAMNQFFRKDQNLPNWINRETADTSYDTQRNITALRFTADGLTPLEINTALSASYLWKHERYDDIHGSVGLGRQLNEYTTRRLTGGLFAEWVTRHNILSTNVEVLHETYEPEDLLQKVNPKDSTRDMVTAAVQDNVILWGERVVVSPAVRFVWLEDDMHSGETVWGAALAKEERTDSYAMPQAGVKAKPFHWLTLKANVAEYVREPSFFELFGDRGFFLGNDNLVAEKGVNWDAGFEVSVFPGHEWLSHVALGAAYFHSDVEDLITRTYDARGVGKSVNISEADISGVEATATVDLLRYFTASGNFTWQDPVAVNQVIPAFDDKRLPGRHEYSAVGKLTARFAGVMLYGEYVYENGIYYDSANFVEAPEKKELNAGAAYTYKGFTLEVEGRNLRDRQHEDFNGYPQPGRAFFATLRHDL
ncbi:MAG: TonB-dependent receptor [Desulfatibacillaceae bacterium]